MSGLYNSSYARAHDPDPPNLVFGMIPSPQQIVKQQPPFDGGGEDTGQVSFQEDYDLGYIAPGTYAHSPITVSHMETYGTPHDVLLSQYNAGGVMGPIYSGYSRHMISRSTSSSSSSTSSLQEALSPEVHRPYTLNEHAGYEGGQVGYPFYAQRFSLSKEYGLGQNLSYPFSTGEAHAHLRRMHIYVEYVSLIGLGTHCFAHNSPFYQTMGLLDQTAPSVSMHMGGPLSSIFPSESARLPGPILNGHLYFGERLTSTAPQSINSYIAGQDPSATHGHTLHAENVSVLYTAGMSGDSKSVHHDDRNAPSRCVEPRIIRIDPSPSTSHVRRPPKTSQCGTSEGSHKAVDSKKLEAKRKRKQSREKKFPCPWPDCVYSMLPLEVHDVVLTACCCCTLFYM